MSRNVGPPMSDTDDLLTPEELAKKLKHCSVSTVYRMQADGEIPGRLVRGKLRFVYAEVLRALPAAPAANQARTLRHAQGLAEVRLLKRLVQWGNGR